MRLDKGHKDHHMGFSYLLHVCYHPSDLYICTRLEVEGKCASLMEDDIADMKNQYDNI